MNELERFVKTSPLSPLVKVIPLKTNVGFAGGSLEGLRHVHGEYIALLNNDTEPDERWIEELAEAMDASPEIVMCASKMIVHGTDIIDSAEDGFSLHGDGGIVVISLQDQLFPPEVDIGAMPPSDLLDGKIEDIEGEPGCRPPSFVSFPSRTARKGVPSPCWRGSSRSA